MSDMLDIATALYDFWNGFGIQAYANEPPELAELPYIVYQVTQGQSLGEANDYVRIFYEGKYTRDLYDTANKINEKIGQGIVVPLNGGGNLTIWQIVWTPLPDSENLVALYGNFSINYNL